MSLEVGKIVATNKAIFTSFLRLASPPHLTQAAARPTSVLSVRRLPPSVRYLKLDGRYSPKIPQNVNKTVIVNEANDAIGKFPNTRRDARPPSLQTRHFTILTVDKEAKTKTVRIYSIIDEKML